MYVLVENCEKLVVFVFVGGWSPPTLQTPFRTESYPYAYNQKSKIKHCIWHRRCEKQDSLLVVNSIFFSYAQFYAFPRRHTEYMYIHA